MFGLGESDEYREQGLWHSIDDWVASGDTHLASRFRAAGLISLGRDLYTRVGHPPRY